MLNYHSEKWLDNKGVLKYRAYEQKNVKRNPETFISSSPVQPQENKELLQISTSNDGKTYRHAHPELFKSRFKSNNCNNNNANATVLNTVRHSPDTMHIIIIIVRATQLSNISVYKHKSTHSWLICFLLLLSLPSFILCERKREGDIRWMSISLNIKAPLFISATTWNTTRRRSH